MTRIIKTSGGFVDVAAVSTGTRPPGGNVGEIGDIYVDTDSKKLHLKTDHNRWINMLSVDLLDPWLPDRNVYVGNGEFDTVQSAVDYAAGLSGSTDLTGITVWIPGGFFDETVIIRKNINFKGTGRSATKITRLEVRPSSDILAPAAVRCFDIEINNLVVDNQTTAVSGIYNTLNHLETELLIQDCLVGTYNIQNAFNISFESCELGLAAEGLTSRNTNGFYLKNCFYEDEITHTMDSTVAHALVQDGPPVLDGNFWLINSSGFAAVNALTAGGSVTRAVLEGLNSFVGQINVGAGSALAFRGCATLSATIDPGAEIFAFSCLQAFTPTTSGDWPSQPISVDDALDKLAARVKALEDA